MNNEQVTATTVMLLARRARISLRLRVSGPLRMPVLLPPNDLGLAQELRADRELLQPGSFDVDPKPKLVLDDPELDHAVVRREHVRLTDRQDVSAVEGRENVLQFRSFRCADVQDVAAR